MVVSMLPVKYLCLMNCISADFEFNILILGANSDGLLFTMSIRASTTSGLWARSLTLCLARVSVPGVVFGEEVVDLVLDLEVLGVLGLGGTWASLDRGRGWKLSSLSDENKYMVLLISGGGRVLMMDAKGLSGAMILEYPAPRLRKSAGWSWFLRMISLERRGSWVEDWYLLWALPR